MTRYTLDYSTDNRPLYRRAGYLRGQQSRFRTLLLLTAVFVVALLINQLRLHTENNRLTEQHRQAQFRYDSLLRQWPAPVVGPASAPAVPFTTQPQRYDEPTVSGGRATLAAECAEVMRPDTTATPRNTDTD